MAKKIKQDTTDLIFGGDPFKIAIPTKMGLVMVASKNILRCEANRAYCNFYLVDGKKLVVCKSLKFFEEKLVEWNFFRVHKSNLVNIHHIDKFNRGKLGSIVLTDNSKVQVSIRKKKELLERLLNSYTAHFTEPLKRIAV